MLSEEDSIFGVLRKGARNPATEPGIREVGREEEAGLQAHIDWLFLLTGSGLRPEGGAVGHKSTDSGLRPPPRGSPARKSFWELRFGPRNNLLC